MADQRSLRAIGIMLGAVTAAVSLVAATFVVTIDSGSAEQPAMVLTSSHR
jgi:hypothetical protein